MTQLSETERLQKLFHELRTEVCGELVKRDDGVDLILLCMVAKLNGFILSEPGLAKSLMWARITDRIAGMNEFSVDFTKHTMPDEVVGPQSLSELRQDRLIRKIEGFLPWADGALLDELPRAAEATATIMTRILNERVFNQDGRKTQIPLHFAIACANSTLTAEHEGLGHLWDRFPVRRALDPLTEAEDLRAIWNTEILPSPPPVLTWQDVQAAHVDACQVVIPDDVFDAAVKIVRALADKGMRLSNRRWRQSKTLIQATAWLDGETVAALRHLEVFADMGWDNPDQIPLAEKVVATETSPDYAEAITYVDTVTSLEDDLVKMVADADAIEAGSLPMVHKMGRIGGDLMDKAAASHGRTAKSYGDSLSRLTALWNDHGHTLSNVEASMSPPFDMVIERSRRR